MLYSSFVQIIFLKARPGYKRQNKVSFLIIPLDSEVSIPPAALQYPTIPKNCSDWIIPGIIYLYYIQSCEIQYNTDEIYSILVKI